MTNSIEQAKAILAKHGFNQTTPPMARPKPKPLPVMQQPAPTPDVKNPDIEKEPKEPQIQIPKENSINDALMLAGVLDNYKTQISERYETAQAMVNKEVADKLKNIGQEIKQKVETEFAKKLQEAFDKGFDEGAKAGNEALAVVDEVMTALEKDNQE